MMALLVIGEDDVAQGERLAPRVQREVLATRLHSSALVTAATSVATQRACHAVQPLFAIEVALMLVQVQAAGVSSPIVWLLTMGAQAACKCTAHMGSWGFSRAARAEATL